MKSGKLILGAFVVSACAGLLGEALYSIFAAVLPPNAAMLVPVLVLLVFGVIGALLVITGTYERVEHVSEMGIMGAFVGLPPAAAGLFMKSQQESGSAAKGAGKAIGGLLVLIIISAVVPVALGLAKTLLF